MGQFNPGLSRPLFALVSQIKRLSVPEQVAFRAIIAEIDAVRFAPVIQPFGFVAPSDPFACRG
ncbi:MAG: hypothetical protein ABSC63_06765 [Candidatus Binataceae bacterium]|jgi:hypothetical protein